MGYSPLGLKESDMTEATSYTCTRLLNALQVEDFKQQHDIKSLAA